MDRRGNLCAGVSSGGVLFKTPGRIGQVSAHFRVKASSYENCKILVINAKTETIKAFHVIKRVSKARDKAIIFSKGGFETSFSHLSGFVFK